MDQHATAQRAQTSCFVQLALALHQRGRLDEAGQIYDAVLAADPNDFDALHLGGVLRHQQGRSLRRSARSPDRRMF
jgi:tetratricopeptide (TPR) repeat protein